MDGTLNGSLADDTMVTGVPPIEATVLEPLPQPPATPAPGSDSEPSITGRPISALSELFIVEDPPIVFEESEPEHTDADFDAGTPAPVVIRPPSVDLSANAPPGFPDLVNQEVLAGEELRIELRPVDPDGGLPGMFPGELPEGSRYVDNLDGSRSLIWQPLEPDVGIRDFVITAVDPVEPQYRTEQRILIRVLLPDDVSTIENRPPTINLVRRHTVRVGDPVVIEIRATDPNGTYPSLEITSALPGATFIAHATDPGTRILRFVASTAGVLDIDVRATDAIDPSLGATQQIRIDVQPPERFDLEEPALRELAAAGGLLIGYSALQDFYHRPDGALYGAIAGEQFNLVTTENALKWSLVNPAPGHYRWASADNLRNFARLHRQTMHGHPLVWHRQLPDWVMQSAPASREWHMREYIDRVLTRYRDDIALWDVVNEALDETGGLRDSLWLDAMGPDYIDIAFRQARVSAPDAILLYNDYDLLTNDLKGAALIQLLENLVAIGTPIDGVGFQMHLFADFDDFSGAKAMFSQVAALGLDIYITELDVSMRDQDTLEDQANVYAGALALCRAEVRCKALQTWGFTDQYSWRREFTPLLFDTSYRPKPAYFALQKGLNDN